LNCIAAAKPDVPAVFGGLMDQLFKTCSKPSKCTEIGKEVFKQVPLDSTNSKTTDPHLIIGVHRSNIDAKTESDKSENKFDIKTMKIKHQFFVIFTPEQSNLVEDEILDPNTLTDALGIFSVTIVDDLLHVDVIGQYRGGVAIFKFDEYTNWMKAIQKKYKSFSALKVVSLEDHASGTCEYNDNGKTKLLLNGDVAHIGDYSHEYLERRAADDDDPFGTSLTIFSIIKYGSPFYTKLVNAIPNNILKFKKVDPEHPPRAGILFCPWSKSKKKAYCAKLKPLFDLGKVKISTFINDFSVKNKGVWNGMTKLIATKANKVEADLTINDIVVNLKPSLWVRIKTDCEQIAAWYYALVEWECASDTNTDCKKRYQVLQDAQKAALDDGHQDMTIYPKAMNCHTISKPTC